MPCHSPCATREARVVRVNELCECGHGSMVSVMLKDITCNSLRNVLTVLLICLRMLKFNRANVIQHLESGNPASTMEFVNCHVQDWNRQFCPQPLVTLDPIVTTQSQVAMLNSPDTVL